MTNSGRTEAREQARQHLITDPASVAAELNAAIEAANGRCRQRCLEPDWTPEEVLGLVECARQHGAAQHSAGHGHAVPNSYRGRATATMQDVYVYADVHGMCYLAHRAVRGDVPHRSHGRGGPDDVDASYLASTIDPRLGRVRRRRRAELARRRVRDIRRWWSEIRASVDARQRAQVRRHLTADDRVQDAEIRADDRGILLVIDRPGGRYCYCIVRDATHPERLHALPVPPDTESCLAGLAWCAQMDEDEYSQLACEA